GKQAVKGQRVRGGEILELSAAIAQPWFAVLPNPGLELAILYQDEFLFAVDKAAGIACHPLQPQERRTVANAVVARFPEQAELEPRREAGLVHRLDNETSGVLLFARRQEALMTLRNLAKAEKSKRPTWRGFTAAFGAREKSRGPSGII